MIVLWLAISTIALLCGISVEQQITANLRKYKNGAYELSTKIIYESPYETLLETTNTTSRVVSRLRLILLEVYKSLHLIQLNANCINGLSEVKSTWYSLRNPAKVLQPNKKTTTLGLKSISYTGAKLWNNLFPILSNNVEFDVFKASLKILNTDHLDPTFTYV